MSDKSEKPEKQSYRGFASNTGGLVDPVLTESELIASARYLIDSEGNKEAVLVDFAVWEKLLDMLRRERQSHEQLPTKVREPRHVYTARQMVLETLNELQALPDLDSEMLRESIARYLEKAIRSETGPGPVTLEQLVAQITPENMHGETSTGQPVGDEVW